MNERKIIMDKKRIGLIGCGGIMNGAHIPGYLECPDCEITAIADISPDALKRTGDRLGIPEEHRFSTHTALLNSGLIDAVDIATSNDAHVPIAIDALNAGFPVSVEKPIGLDFGESAALLKKAEETGLPVFVCFSWRYRLLPRYMKKLIDDGKLGKLYHIYIRCVKDSGLWVGRRLEWRFIEERSGSGVLCDLGSHMFDMIRFFGEEFENVYCDRGIIVEDRQLPDSDEWGKVTTDDWSNVTFRLKSGIGANVIISRCVTNEKDSIEFYLVGEKGSLKFVYNNGKQYLCECTGENMKTNTFVKIEPPADFAVGGQSRSYVDLLNGHPDEYAAEILEGLRSQAAVDAAKLSSQTGRAITIRELYEMNGLKAPTE